MENLMALWAQAREKAKRAWQWITLKVKALPVSRQAIVQVAAVLAAGSLWGVFKTVPGAIPAALAMTMVVADLALILALLAYGGVDAIFNAAKQTEKTAA